jgi:hypothetical protein
VITPPDYTIIVVNDVYLRATMTERSAVLGRRVFDVFPDNPHEPSIEGPPKLVRERDLAHPTAGGVGDPGLPLEGRIHLQARPE